MDPQQRLLLESSMNSFLTEDLGEKMALQIETCQMDPNGLLAVSFTFKSFKVSDARKQLIDPIARICTYLYVYIYMYR